jgi:hypothetical protein
LERIKVPQEEIETMVDAVHQRRFDKMFTMWEEYDVQETRRIARQEGMQLGEKRGMQLGEKRGIELGEARAAAKWGTVVADKEAEIADKEAEIARLRALLDKTKQ